MYMFRVVFRRHNIEVTIYCESESKISASNQALVTLEAEISGDIGEYDHVSTEIVGKIGA